MRGPYLKKKDDDLHRMTRPDEETTEMLADSLARTVSTISETVNEALTQKMDEVKQVDEVKQADEVKPVEVKAPLMEPEPFICRCTKCIREYSNRVQHKTESLCQKLYTLFTKHPHQHNLTYAKHAMRALRMAFRLGKGAFALCVHSLFPFLCEKTGTNTVNSLYEEIHKKQE